MITQSAKLQCAKSKGGALAFQHQHKRRRVAAHAVGWAAKQLFHVRNRRTTNRSLSNEHSCAIAAGAPNRQFDCINNGWCAVGGGGKRLHSTIAISSAARATGRGALNATRTCLIWMGASFLSKRSTRRRRQCKSGQGRAACARQRSSKHVLRCDTFAAKHSAQSSIATSVSCFASQPPPPPPQQQQQQQGSSVLVASSFSSHQPPYQTTARIFTASEQARLGHPDILTPLQ